MPSLEVAQCGMVDLGNVAGELYVNRLTLSIQYGRSDNDIRGRCSYVLHADG